jgi:predicted Fe-S protein YdhL (DUF1289 family)
MAVKSPCIDLCAFDGKTGLCTGCYRTREEARDWKKMTVLLSHQILNEKSRRQTKLTREAPQTEKED